MVRVGVRLDLEPLQRLLRDAMAAISWRRDAGMTAVVGFCRVGTQYRAFGRRVRQAAANASGRRPCASMATPCRRKASSPASVFIPGYVSASVATTSPGPKSAAKTAVMPCWLPLVMRMRSTLVA